MKKYLVVDQSPDCWSTEIVAEEESIPALLKSVEDAGYALDNPYLKYYEVVEGTYSPPSEDATIVFPGRK